MPRPDKLRRKAYLISILITFLLWFCGCSSGVYSQSSSEIAPHLSIHTEASFGTTRISSEDLGGHLERGILYEGVTNVTIDIAGTSMKLEDAVRDGFITPAQLFTYPRLDTENGFCTESTRVGRSGLTAFVYTYPDAEVWIVYDVLATPDGQQHLIQDLRIFYPGGSKHESPGSYLDLETHTRIDREDWGITLEINELSPNSITLNCIQTSGQQIGQLHMYAYSVRGITGPIGEPVMVDCSTDIQMNGSTELVLDWSELYGDLPCGEYTLLVAVQDIYDYDNVHPLMQNFTDYQDYQVQFTIP